MALVLQDDALQQLQGQVPLPAVVQEFVNHGGLQYKVYVLGEQVGTSGPCSIGQQSAVLRRESFI